MDTQTLFLKYTIPRDAAVSLWSQSGEELDLRYVRDDLEEGQHVGNFTFQAEASPGVHFVLRDCAFLTILDRVRMDDEGRLYSQTVGVFCAMTEDVQAASLFLVRCGEKGAPDQLLEFIFSSVLGNIKKADLGEPNMEHVSHLDGLPANYNAGGAMLFHARANG